MDHREWRLFQSQAGNILDTAWEYPARTFAFRIGESELWNTEVETLDLPREVVLHFSFSIEFHLFLVFLYLSVLHTSLSLSLSHRPPLFRVQTAASKEFPAQHTYTFLHRISLGDRARALLRAMFTCVKDKVRVDFDGLLFTGWYIDYLWTVYRWEIVYIIWFKSYSMAIDWPGPGFGGPLVVLLE